MKRRKYTLKKRAQQQEETRERIVQATVDLHETLGVSRTTVSAIAERAGVQRLTVYRHFPDEAALLRACTSHWAADHPAPDGADWAEIDDPVDRAREALTRVFAFFREAESMWTGVYRDVGDQPLLVPYVEQFEAYLQGIRDDLAKAFAASGAASPDLALVLGHLVAFSTWKSWHEQGADESTMVGLAVDWLRCLARRAEGQLSA